jgi:hypothetical protein
VDTLPCSDFLLALPVKSGLVAIACRHMELLSLGLVANQRLIKTLYALETTVAGNQDAVKNAAKKRSKLWS